MIRITIEGPTHSGKGYAMSAITKCLADLGADVEVQSATTHNASKLEKNKEQLSEGLTGRKIVVMEMQTSM